MVLNGIQRLKGINATNYELSLCRTWIFLFGRQLGYAQGSDLSTYAKPWSRPNQAEKIEINHTSKKPRYGFRVQFRIELAHRTLLRLGFCSVEETLSFSSDTSVTHLRVLMITRGHSRRLYLVGIGQTDHTLAYQVIRYMYLRRVHTNNRSLLLPRRYKRYR
jgi:hypothetical protein